MDGAIGPPAKKPLEQGPWAWRGSVTLVSLLDNQLQKKASP